MENVVQIPSLTDATRRAAVYTTLKQWFDQQQILEALCVIEDLDDGKSSMGVIKLTNLLADHFNWEINLKHDVRMSLYRNMLPSAKLDPDPIKELTAYKANRKPIEKKEPKKEAPAAQVATQEKTRPAANAAYGQESAMFIVFAQVIEGIRKTVETSYAQHMEDFHAAVNSEIQQLTLSPYVIQWVEGVFNAAEGGLTNSGLSEPHMAAIVHAFYNAVSDAVGPMDADRVLTSAIALAEKSPAAAQFPPQNFL